MQGGVYAQVMNAESSPGRDTTDIPIDASVLEYARRRRPRAGFPVSRSNTQILSYGGFLAYDTRDNSIGLTRGVNIYGRVASADGLGHHDASDDYRWIEREFDVRGTLRSEVPGRPSCCVPEDSSRRPKDGSQIPFYDLSWLGGREYLRGYHSYRFRGNNVLLLSTELQRTVHAMTPVRGVDLFASADTGQVWGDARSSTDPAILDNQDFQLAQLALRHSEAVFSIGTRAASPLESKSAGVASSILIYWSLSRGF